MPPTSRWTALLTAATVTTALAGCGGAGTVDSPEHATTPAAAPDAYLLAEELAYLPAPSDDGPVQIQAADYERVGELLGTPKPMGPDAPLAELTDWTAAVTVPGVSADHPLGAMLPDALAWRTHLNNSDVIESELGVSFRSVLRYVEAISAPDSATVIQGPYDPAAIDAALGSTDDGVWSFGEELVSDPALMMASPPLGAGLSLGETGDGRLLLFRREAPLRGIQQGDTATLADDPALLALAGAFDTHGWYSVMVLAGRDFARSIDEPALEPFVAVGAAVDMVDGNSVIHVGYAHDDADLAGANQQLVTDLLAEGRMADGVRYLDRFELVDTSVDGTVLLVTLAPQDVPVGVIWTVLSQQESLVTHR